MGIRRYLRRHYRTCRYKAMNFGKVVDFAVLKDSKKAVRAASKAPVDIHLEQVPAMKERYLDRPWFKPGYVFRKM
jgi:hypothetical protein